MKTNATAEIKLITPEIVNEWLSNRWGEQRSVRNSHVSRIALDMEEGRFKMSPDAILRIKGKLANGQHRLSAVVKSGISQSFLVMESNDEELYKVLDAGIKRTVSDSFIGVQFAKTIPSIARCILSYYNRASQNGEDNEKRTLSQSQCEIIEYCEKNQGKLCEAAQFVNPLYTQTCLLPVSITGALYVICSNDFGKLEKMKEFIRDIYIDGGNTSAGDLRNRLISNKGGKARLNSGYLLAITLKAFNHYIKGTRNGNLKWSETERFPTI